MEVCLNLTAEQFREEIKNLFKEAIVELCGDGILSVKKHHDDKKKKASALVFLRRIFGNGINVSMSDYAG